MSKLGMFLPWQVDQLLFSSLRQFKISVIQTLNAFNCIKGDKNSIFFSPVDLLLGFFFFGGVFLGPHPQHMEVPRLEIESELQLPTTATATAMPDPSHVSTYTSVHSSTGSLTHWVRPGIKPSSSWILVGFVTAERQWELLLLGILNIVKIYLKHPLNMSQSMQVRLEYGLKIVAEDNFLVLPSWWPIIKKFTSFTWYRPCV